MDRQNIEQELIELHDLAVTLARQAGDVQRSRYETELDVRTKSASIDLVTEVDKECEQLIVEGIEARRPDDAILAEEGGGNDRAGARIRWVIDPLDGTTNYAHGFPRFCVSIGVERVGKQMGEQMGEGIGERGFERVAGVVYDPLLDELFHAVKGAGAWLGQRALAVSRESRLDRALIATGFAYDVHKNPEDNLERFASMLKAARGLRRDGSAALDLCYVAAGRLDAYWEYKLHAWDVAAGFLIVEEAGGRVTDSQGGPAPRSGEDVVSSNGVLHDAILDQLAR
jgi:myo-inositol-1(or 4)-monophosphatase